MPDFGSAIEREEFGYSRPFEASFNSECPSCGTPIDEGDWIVRDNDDGSYIHEGCKETDD